MVLLLLDDSNGSITRESGIVEIADITDLGQVLGAARARRGWSQQQAADAAGVSRRLVNLLEGGRHPNAEVWRVLALLNALDVPLLADPFHVASADQPSDDVGNQDDIDLDTYLATFRNGVSRA